jgi:hypothetical protein
MYAHLLIFHRTVREDHDAIVSFVLAHIQAINRFTGNAPSWYYNSSTYDQETVLKSNCDAITISVDKSVELAGTSFYGSSEKVDAFSLIIVLLLHNHLTIILSNRAIQSSLE